MSAEPGIVIILAGAPQGKGRPRIGRMANGRPMAFTPANTRSYESALRLAAQERMRDRAPWDGPIELQMEARFPVPASWSRRKREDALAGRLAPTTKPDADNLLKTLDALNEVVWRDDRQIVSATVRKLYSERPALWIRVAPLLARAGA